MTEPTHTLEIRVRYPECDPMGVAHHTAYPVWFEMGRTELCRESLGLSYRDLEARGIMLAVTRLEVRYAAPARYDDVLRLQTGLSRATKVKLEHEYRLTRDDILLSTGTTTVACLDRQGKPQLLPLELSG